MRIEINEKYFNSACKRIADVSRQKDLFIDIKPRESEQLVWDSMWQKPFDKPELL